MPSDQVLPEADDQVVWDFTKTAQRARTHPQEHGDCQRRGNGLQDTLCVQTVNSPDLGPAGLPEVEISL